MTMTFDPFEPRTNKSVAAFAAAIRDQLSAVLRSDFVAGQGFAKFQLWQTKSDSPGTQGMYLGDNSTAFWNWRTDTSSNLCLDRFISGTGWKNMLVCSNARGSIGIGGDWQYGGKFSILDPSPWAAGGSMRGSVVLLDTTPQAANTGTGIVFGMTHNDLGAIAWPCGITAYKLNSTSGDYSAGLRFSVQSVSGGMVDALTLDPFGKVGIGGAPSYPLDVRSTSSVIQLRLKAVSSSVTPSMLFEDGAATPKTWRAGMGLVSGTDGVFYLIDNSSGIARIAHDQLGNTAFNANGALQTGGGQGVIAIANATVPPTTNPAGGAVMYAQSGAMKVRGSSGTTTTFGPADPHCPACGADFTNEFYNPRYGYVSICMFCLAADHADKPYVVRHQTEEHVTEVAQRDAEVIADAKAERLAEAVALIEADQEKESGYESGSTTDESDETSPDPGGSVGDAAGND